MVNKNLLYCLLACMTISLAPAHAHEDRGVFNSLCSLSYGLFYYGVQKPVFFAASSLYSASGMSSTRGKIGATIAVSLAIAYKANSIYESNNRVEALKKEITYFNANLLGMSPDADKKDRDSLLYYLKKDTGSVPRESGVGAEGEGDENPGGVTITSKKNILLAYAARTKSKSVTKDTILEELKSSQVTIGHDLLEVNIPCFVYLYEEELQKAIKDIEQYIRKIESIDGCVSCWYGLGQHKKDLESMRAILMQIKLLFNQEKKQQVGTPTSIFVKKLS